MTTEIPVLLLAFIVGALMLIAGLSWFHGRKTYHWLDPYMGVCFVFVGGVAAVVSLLGGFLLGVGLVK